LVGKQGGKLFKLHKTPRDKNQGQRIVSVLFCIEEGKGKENVGDLDVLEQKAKGTGS